MVSVCCLHVKTGRRMETRATSSRSQTTLLRWCWRFLCFCSSSLHFVQVHYILFMYPSGKKKKWQILGCWELVWSLLRALMEVTVPLSQSGKRFTPWRSPAWWTLSWPVMHAPDHQQFAKVRRRKTGRCFKGSVSLSIFGKNNMNTIKTLVVKNM